MTDTITDPVALAVELEGCWALNTDQAREIARLHNVIRAERHAAAFQHSKIGNISDVLRECRMGKVTDSEAIRQIREILSRVYELPELPKRVAFGRVIGG